MIIKDKLAQISRNKRFIEEQEIELQRKEEEYKASIAINEKKINEFQKDNKTFMDSHVCVRFPDLLQHLATKHKCDVAELSVKQHFAIPVSVDINQLLTLEELEEALTAYFAQKLIISISKGSKELLVLKYRVKENLHLSQADGEQFIHHIKLIEKIIPPNKFVVCEFDDLNQFVYTERLGELVSVGFNGEIKYKSNFAEMLVTLAMSKEDESLYYTGWESWA